jgi:mono/diheme cytochrome c family protein
MKRLILDSLILIAFSPLVIHAQAQSSANISPSDVRKMGQRLFQQRCSVCHIPTAYATRSYGPRLYKDFVLDNEDYVRGIILDGRPGFMPGWKYTLQSEQIDEIIEYLKTVEKPARPKS